MAECRHLLCDQEADFLVTVNRAGASKTARYCDKHLTRVTEAIDMTESATLTSVKPIKRGTTMPDTPPEHTGPNPLREQVARQSQSITSLNEAVTNLNAENTNLESVNADLKRDVAAADATIGRMKENHNRLNGDLTAMRKDRDALVNALHGLGNEMDAIGNDDVVRLIDDILEKGKYPARIKHFEIIVTVPAQVRIKVDAKDKDTAREMFEQGKVGWRSEDYEEWLEDDTEVVEIVEVEQ